MDIELYGGNQGYWTNQIGFSDLAKYGCGTVVMCDAEYILSNDPAFPQIVKSKQYTDYVEEAYKSRYRIRFNPIPALKGLTPMQMKTGIKRRFGSKYRVKWAFCRKNKSALMFETKRMLSKNIPVVCSYFSLTGKGLPLYESIGAPMPVIYVNNHYMRIESLSDDERFFTIISWGKRYYALVSDFLTKLGLFTNILSIWDCSNSE